jgi:hypothetical protein
MKVFIIVFGVLKYNSLERVNSCQNICIGRIVQIQKFPFVFWKFFTTSRQSVFTYIVYRSITYCDMTSETKNSGVRETAVARERLGKYVSATAVTSRNNRKTVGSVVATRSGARRIVSLRWNTWHHVTYVNRGTMFSIGSVQRQYLENPNTNQSVHSDLDAVTTQIYSCWNYAATNVAVT